MSDENRTPQGLGWIMPLVRWSQTDATVVGQDGPLPPPRVASRPTGMDNGMSSMPRGQLGMLGGNLLQYGNEPTNRLDLYRIYEAMDRTDLAGSALDLYAEDATPVDPETGRTVWIKSKNKDMVERGNEMLHRIRIEEEATALARDIAKYGDDFERFVYRSAKSVDDKEAGVQRMLRADPKEMTRVESKQGKLEGYKQVGRKYRSGTNETSLPWDYVHFRLRGSDRGSPYGTSLLRNAIRPWRQMMILEDWMIRYQTTRHPDRNLFLVDGGTSAETDRAEMARKFKQKLKRTMIVDPAGTSGRNYDYAFNPITPDEDLVMVVSRGSETRIEKMSGSANAPDIAPLDYVLNKFFAAIRAPKSFFGIGQASGEEINRKASLSSQDVRYARGCQRIQRAIRTGITYAAEFHYLLLQGNDPEASKYDWTNPANAFTVNMSPISFLAELERLEVMQIRQQVAVALADMGRDNPAYIASEWTKFILRDIIKVPQSILGEVLRTSDEVLAAQRAILAAQPTDMHTALPTGVGAQTQLAQKQFGLEKQNAEMAVDQQQHQQKMDKAALKQQAQQESDATKRAEDAVAAVRARGVQSDGELRRGDAELLTECLARNPALRRVIELGAIMWRDNGETIIETHGATLPDRKSSLHKSGKLDDILASDDMEDAAEEAADETGKAGA